VQRRPLSAKVAPILRHFLLPVTSGAKKVSANAVKMGSTPLIAPFLPLCIEPGIRQWGRRRWLTHSRTAYGRQRSTATSSSDLPDKRLVRQLSRNSQTKAPGRRFLPACQNAVRPVV
jgi:hypothetical protein